MHRINRWTLQLLSLQVHKSLDVEGTGQNIGPDLGINCLQRVSVDGIEAIEYLIN